MEVSGQFYPSHIEPLENKLPVSIVQKAGWEPEIVCTIHSFSSLSYDRSKASSKVSSPHSAIHSFLLQMRVSSPFLKVIQ